jgi:DedD protein
MARQLSADEQNLRRAARRRLIGAFALTLAVVVILPMVLESEPGPTGKDIELQIPSPDEIGNIKARMPAPDVSTVNSAQTAESDALPVSAAVATVPVTAAADHPVDTKAPAMEVQPVRATPPVPTAAPAESFVVQVGAYSNAATAKQELATLKKWGFKAYTEKQGDVMRVRVGPYAEREKADKVRGMLEKHGLKAVVMNARS